MKARRARAPRTNTLALSQLDVIANCLGAVLLLFLVMSATVSRPASRAGGSHAFLYARWEIAPAGQARNCGNALFNLILSRQGPDDLKPTRAEIPFAQLAQMADGAVPLRPFPGSPEEIWTSWTTGESRARAPRRSEQPVHLRALVAAPRKGEWRLDLRYASEVGIRAMLPDCAAVRVERVVIASSGGQSRVADPERSEVLEYGGTTALKPLNVEAEETVVAAVLKEP